MLGLSDEFDQALSSAQSYAEWKSAALRYDRRHRLDRWKKSDQADCYDYEGLRTLVQRLRALRAAKDDHGLLFALNEGIHGNMGGMASRALYQKARSGTKKLIVDYTEEVASALAYLASPKVASISLEEKIDFFHRASHCYGRSALMLSGAAMLVYFHIGVVKALCENDLLPSIVTGASGGALVAALLGTHSKRDLAKIFEPACLMFERREESGVFRFLSALRTQNISVEEVRGVFARLIPDLTFQEAFERTGIHINISVSPAEPRHASRLLNSITSPNVMIREAVLASCSVPGLYPPVTLVAKDVNGGKKPYLPSRKWVDGSLSGDLPIKRVMRLYGVNHVVVSQTNPLVLPFVTGMKEQLEPWDVIEHALRTTSKAWLLAGTRLARKRATFFSPALQKLIGVTESLLSQSYSGDINILPPKRVYGPKQLLSPASLEEIMQLIDQGERATWPEIEAIRIQTMVSRLLDDIIHKYERDLLKRSRRVRRRATA
jgi:NTE family protein